MSGNEQYLSKSFAALILSSGLSERMGKPKALLQWDASTTFIQKLIGEYLEAGCQKVVCTVNPVLYPVCISMKLPGNVKFILNEHPDWGRMYSVQLGLIELRGSDFCLLQNVDNPYIHAGIINRIKEAADAKYWCSPEYQGQSGHPVLLPEKVMNGLLHDHPQASTLQDLLHRFPKKVVSLETDVILKNINCPEDYLDFLERNC